MPRRPLDPLASPTLAETAFADRGRPAQQISMQGYGPANRVLGGIVVLALAIGAALPLRAGSDDLATGLAALGAMALIAGETDGGMGGNPLPRIEAPRPQPELRFRGEDDHWPVNGCAREMGPPYGKAWGYRAKHGCAPAPGHHDRGPERHGKKDKGH